ncbi:hypothetical protein LTR65_001359 [Meristemomyces frigidus]
MLIETWYSSCSKRGIDESYYSTLVNILKVTDKVSLAYYDFIGELASIQELPEEECNADGCDFAIVLFAKVNTHAKRSVSDRALPSRALQT